VALLHVSGLLELREVAVVPLLDLITATVFTVTRRRRQWIRIGTRIRVGIGIAATWRRSWIRIAATGRVRAWVRVGVRVRASIGVVARWWFANAGVVARWWSAKIGVARFFTRGLRRPITIAMREAATRSSILRLTNYLKRDRRR
jgi:hypothetical protein